MSLSKQQQRSFRWRSVSSMAVAMLLVGVFGAACDETLEATLAGDGGADGAADGQSSDATTTTDGSSSTDGSQNTDSTTTDSSSDAPSDSANDGASDGSSDGASDAKTDASDAAADAKNDADAGPALCVTSPLSADDAQIIAIEYVIAMGAKCELGGFTRASNQMLTVEDCFGIFIRERIGCPGVTYAGSTSGATGDACGGFFVHPLDGATFSNSDFDQAMLALETALDSAGMFTGSAERAAFLAAMSSSRSTVVTSASGNLTHSTCDGGVNN